MVARSQDQPYLVFGQPAFDDATIDEIADSLRRGWIGTGPKVVRFQEMVREYVGAAHARALNSCTAGLHLSLVVAGIGRGDEVITTPLTFVATLNAIVHAGAEPVLVDVDPATQNIDPDRIAAAITPRTRAIVPVHMAGRPCDLDAIGAIAKDHGLLVIEDAAHAIGASYRGERIGSISDLTCFSFYATKNITTGEGGVVTTHRSDWAEAIEVYSLHGLTKGAWERYSDAQAQHYAAVVPGFKYNLTDLQAAVGLHQFARIDEWQAKREFLWSRYDELLDPSPLQLPAAPEPDTVHARHLYTVMVPPDAIEPDRDDIREELHRSGIGTGVHFIAAHLHPYYADRLPYRRGDLPHAERISDQTVSLPLTPHLHESDIERVVRELQRILGAVVARR